MEEAPPPLVPRGNPLRVGGAIVAVASTVMLVLWMARSGGSPLGVLVGLALVAAATHGVLDALGTYDDPDDERVRSAVRARALVRPLCGLLAAVTIGFLAVSLAVAGRLHPVLTGLGVTTAALGALVAVGRLLERAGILGPDADGAPRPLHRRHGLWVLAIGALVVLPMLGSHSLIDPWETHYGEVAREILARDDWISLWWAQDGWFWSKPVLGFWVQALSMQAFGVRFEAGAMLSAAAEGHTPWPEWAVRLPIAAMALLALYALYRAIARSHGRRAGACAALVLGTMPQWALVTHQTMADMPFVAAITGAFALALLGLSEDPERKVELFALELPGGRELRVGAHHLVLGVIVATVLPQIAMLLAQNVWIGDRSPPIRIVADTFSAGSPGNCGLPGNDRCEVYSATFPRLQPGLQALLWIQGLALVLGVSWGERRARRLLFLGAWWCAAIATMAKGVAGLALPALCLVLLLASLRRWRDFLTLEIPAGTLLWTAAVMPWFVAMIGRHGFPFVDRLLFHDMIKRALGHVHDTNQGDDVSFRYYVWQLGYATFPWVGLVPAAVLGWARTPDADPGSPRRTTESLLAIWLVVTFALFSLMETKFHHYILPALPPIGALCGITLDRLLERPRGASLGARHARAVTGVIAVGGAALVVLVARDLVLDATGAPGPARLMHLFTYNYGRSWPADLEVRGVLAGFALVAAVATALAVAPRLARASSVALGAVAIAFATWTLCVYFVRASPHWGQRELVLAWIAANREEAGPLAAYQTNWKGENFYSGNHLPAFVSTGRPFREWIASQRKKGVRTFYFISLPDRTDTLASEVGLPARTRADGSRAPSGVERLTSPELNDKLVLVRVRFARGTVAPTAGGEG